MKPLFLLTLLVALCLPVCADNPNDRMPSTCAITNVNVFDGKTLSRSQTIYIENGRIAAARPATLVDADIIDGAGATLMPGLIDSHVHLGGRQDLEQSAQWGVTTLLDMGTPSEQLDSLRHLPELPDIRCSGVSIAPAGGVHALVLGVPAMTSASEAEAFVAARAVEGVDYIKVIIDSPTGKGMVVLDEKYLAALVQAAHRRHLRVVAHVTLAESVAMATRTGVDVITHIPQDTAIDPELANKVTLQRLIVVPTLVLTKGKFSAMSTGDNKPSEAYHYGELSVMALHKAGVPIIAGTDANNVPGAPALTPHGESLHKELELLVKAGLTPIEALRSATSIPAELFNLSDRGIIEPGRWADLLLVEGDPTKDIKTTQNIRGVWISGKRVR